MSRNLFLSRSCSLSRALAHFFDEIRLQKEEALFVLGLSKVPAGPEAELSPAYGDDCAKPVAHCKCKCLMSVCSAARLIILGPHS